MRWQSVKFEISRRGKCPLCLRFSLNRVSDISNIRHQSFSIPKRGRDTPQHGLNGEWTDESPSRFRIYFAVHEYGRTVRCQILLHRDQFRPFPRTRIPSPFFHRWTYSFRKLWKLIELHGGCSKLFSAKRLRQRAETNLFCRKMAIYNFIFFTVFFNGIFALLMACSCVENRSQRKPLLFISI